MKRKAQSCRTNPAARPWREESPRFGGRPHIRRVYLGIVLAWVASAGCGSDNGSTRPASKDGKPNAATSNPSGEPAPVLLLSRMIGAYQSANAYSDSAVLQLREKQADGWAEQTADFSVAFQRPNRLLLKAYQATVSCDGSELTALILDPPSRNLDGQVIVRPAPPTLTLQDLYEEGENVDPVLAEALSGELGVIPITLNLLLADQPLVELLKPTPAMSRLPDKEIDSHPCARVQVETKSGDLVFWIDTCTSALRRLEYPAAKVTGTALENGNLPEVQLVADFVDAQLAPDLADNRFTGEIPASAKKVRYFVVPPPPLPTKLLGEKVKDFWFSDLQGDRVGSRDLAGKIALLAWYQEHPACEAILRQLQTVFEGRTDDDRLAFRAVSVDKPNRSHRDLQKILNRWGVTIPAIRDVAPVGPDVFGIEDAPTVIVLDADGIVQFAEVGANPQLAEILPGLIDRLLRGEPIADDILADHRQREQTYIDQLDLAMSQQPTTVVPLAEPQLAEPSGCEQLKLRSLWRSAELAAPGNIVAIEDDSQAVRFLVLDGWQSVAEFDAKGELVKKHHLPLPSQGAISRLRTLVDGRDRRWFVGFEVHGRRAYLFDENWELVTTYPGADERHEGLADVQLVDLAGDGAVQLIVGFQGIVGVHGVSLEGTRSWGCRKVSSVTSVGVSWPDVVGARQLLVASERGRILPINRFGIDYPEVRVGRWSLHGLFAAKFPSPVSTAYCGMSFGNDGPVAVGINREMDDVWSYPLPAGVFRTQIEPVASAPLLSDEAGCWVFAAADGTVHFVAEDGGFADYLALGRHVTGLTATRIGEKSVLVLAGEKGPVECFEVRGP